MFGLFIFREQMYDVVIHDLFIGYNPWHLLNQEVFRQIRDEYLPAISRKLNYNH